MLFGVKKYADALWEVVKGRGINVHLRQHLVEIKPETKEAVFENLDTNELSTVPYDMIHITPPMGTPPALHSNKDLTDAAGFLSINKETLQHTKYSEILKHLVKLCLQVSKHIWNRRLHQSDHC